MVWSVSPAWEAVELTLEDRLHLPARGPRPFRDRQSWLLQDKCLAIFYLPPTQIVCLLSKASTVPDDDSSKVSDAFGCTMPGGGSSIISGHYGGVTSGDVGNGTELTDGDGLAPVAGDVAVSDGNGMFSDDYNSVRPCLWNLIALDFWEDRCCFGLDAFKPAWAEGRVFTRIHGLLSPSKQEQLLTRMRWRCLSQI